ncbi:unnamed protein product [Bursaphelenchus okinawaensis]|uniref:NOT2_3_5 domain-containing protein n=1 Tax=Bursaphelenchus okinawaensis TaxID=465554 RepID=A0A811L162_9BILA|nr:unnamed protein product [Bursaphelenchus okinawaensis]CAG9115649.1 unnamed protein product [Bursaphelenchus okinawaensis]
MAAEKRKLMVEIDKCFKKIDEGLELFEDMIQKMHEANGENMKEKCQEDLKKEIKKLQRLRDQVKNWQGSNEIKDKEKLNTYRRLIETKMELFKDIERENKTKPHSKIGLSIEEKVDPKEKEKVEVVDWLKAKIRCIQDEIDKTESKLELANSTVSDKKKKNKNKGNKKLNSQEDETETLKKHLERVNFHMDNLEVCMRLLLNEKIRYEDVKNQLMESLDVYVEGLGPDATEDPLDIELDSIYEDLCLTEYIDQLGKVNLSPTDDEKVLDLDKTKPKEIPKASPKLMTASMPHIPTTPRSSFGSHHSLSENQMKTAGSSLPTVPQMKYNAVVKVAGSAAALQTKKVAQEVEKTKFVPYNKLELPGLEVTPDLSPSSAAGDENKKDISLKRQDDLIEIRTKDDTPFTQEYNNHDSFFNSYTAPLDHLARPMSPTNFGISYPTGLTEELFLQQKTETEPETASIQINPFAAYGINQTEKTESQLNVMKQIENAVKNVPTPVDHLRAKNFLAYSPAKTTSVVYPSEMAIEMKTVEYYAKLELETLFFIFYYMEGTFAQRLAARALKSKSWRYHKKFLMWFQRECDPTSITADYECGSYMFFDYERFVIRTRDNFVFEYKYLEQSC